MPSSDIGRSQSVVEVSVPYPTMHVSQSQFHEVGESQEKSVGGPLRETAAFSPSDILFTFVSLSESEEGVEVRLVTTMVLGMVHAVPTIVVGPEVAGGVRIRPFLLHLSDIESQIDLRQEVDRLLITL